MGLEMPGNDDSWNACFGEQGHFVGMLSDCTPRDCAGPKFSGNVMSPFRRFSLMFLQTEQQQTACSRPYPLNMAIFLSITLFTFGFFVAHSHNWLFYSVIFADVSLIAQHNHCNGLPTLIQSLSVVN